VEIVRRPPEVKGWLVLPKRWIVERTFSWLGRYRRLSRDYEHTVASSEAMVYIASAQ
jgi:putative transposase